jgi:hypothetical protein
MVGRRWTPPTRPWHYLDYRQGNTVYGKGGLGDGWTTLTTGATDFKTTYARVAMLDSSNELWAKDSER